MNDEQYNYQYKNIRLVGQMILYFCDCSTNRVHHPSATTEHRLTQFFRKAEVFHNIN